MIESEFSEVNRFRNKYKKIVVTLTAKDSDIQNEMDTSTMDLNKKE
jgi:hypothetical protein